MKKLLFLSLLTVLLAALLATGALAAEADLSLLLTDTVEAVTAVAETESPVLETAQETEEEDTTVITGACGDDLTYRLEDGVLTISGTGKMNASTPWNTTALRNTICKVVIEEGVTTVSGDAFMNCKNLTEVKLPSTLKKINSNAFNTCTSLQEITIPGSVTELGASAFNNCPALRSVVIEDNDGMTLGNGAFYKCTSLSYVYIGEGTASIGATTFQSCEALGSIRLPDSVTKLGTSTFQDCPALANVTLSNNLTRIPQSCFQNCSALTSIVVPDSVTSIGNWAFKACESLSVVDLGNGLTYLGLGSFASCDALPYVIIPYSVTELANGVFSDAGVTEIRFRGNAPKLGGNLFEKLTVTVYYPDDAEGWTSDIMKEYNAKSVNWQSYTVCPDGHTVEPGKDVVVDATLFAPGEIIHTCRICGKTFTEVIPIRTEPNESDIADYDINGDKKVDSADLPALMKPIAEGASEFPENADCNDDGNVDILDVIRLVRFLAAFVF